MSANLFSIWHALPTRIFGAFGWGAMLFATTKPQSANLWLVWLMTAEQTQHYGAIGLAALTLYWVIWFWLKPRDVISGGGVTQKPTSYGSASPTVAVMGDYHHHAAPFATQENKIPNGFLSPELRIQGQGELKKTASPKPYNIDNAAGLYRAISGLRDTDYKRDMALDDVGEYVASVKGCNQISQVELEIADMANEMEMHLWARRGNNPIEMIPTHAFRTLQVELKRDRVTTLGLHAVHRTVWHDVQFSKDEVEKVWPKS